MASRNWPHWSALELLTPAPLSAAPEDDGSGGPPVLRRLTPGVVGTLQYTAPELINEDLRPQGGRVGSARRRWRDRATLAVMQMVPLAATCASAAVWSPLPNQPTN